MSKPARSSVGRRLGIETLEPRNLLAGIVMSGEEQLVLELINRAREAPAVEAARLGVGLNAGLPAGTISSAPKQPLAPNQLLINTAGAHSQDMLDRNFFNHVNPSGQSAGDRITAAGYPWIAYAENIAWSTSMDAEGFHEILFRSASHRKNILKENIREVGIGLRHGNVLKGTEDFGNRWDDAFITGVAFTDDVVHDNFYTIGESSAGLIVTATADGGQTEFTTTTGSSGGYSLQVPPGTYTVTATRGDLPEPMTVNGVTINAENYKIDFVVPEYTPVAPVAHGDRTMTEVGQSAVIDVLANDTGDTHRVVLATNPAHGQAVVDATTGAVTYTPQASFIGLDNLSYRVRGSTGLQSNTVVVQIAVIDLQECPWKNPSLPFDVNASGYVSAEDVLILISDINANGARELPVPTLQTTYPLPYLDPTGEGYLSPRDILGTINHINEQLRGEGEGAMAAHDTLSAPPVVAPPRRQHPLVDVARPDTWTIQASAEFSISAPVISDFETSIRHRIVAARVGDWSQPGASRESLRPTDRNDARDIYFSAMGRLSSLRLDLIDE